MRCALLIAAVFVSGCTGLIDTPAGAGSTLGGPGNIGAGAGPGDTNPPPVTVTPADPTAALPSLTPLRRLTATEYRNTVAQLIPFITPLGDGFSSETGDFGFDSTATASFNVSDTLVQEYFDAAGALAVSAVQANLSTLLGGCNYTSTADTCAKTFIQAFGLKAWRRPLDTSETSAMFALYTRIKSDTGWGTAVYATAIQTVLEAFLQSPNFLYRVEIPSAPGVTDAVVDYALATRLSYLLWRSMPDDALFTAAGNGALRTAADVNAQISRMAQDDRARLALRSYTRQWLEVNRLDSASKSHDVFPTWSDDNKALLEQETDLELDDLVWNGGDVRQLFVGSHTFVNGPLARFYGFTGVTGDAFVRFELPPEQQAGALRLGSIMAGHAHADKTGPFVRAKFLFDQLLCQTLPPPPASVNQTLPPAAANETTRQELERVTAGATCQACHKMMSPYAFAWESIDAVGRWRTVDNGSPVDTTGTFAGGPLTGTVSGAADLASQLSQTQVVTDCGALEIFRYSFGRGAVEGDAQAVLWLQQQLAADHDLKATFTRVAALPEFRFRVNE